MTLSVRENKVMDCNFDVQKIKKITVQMDERAEIDVELILSDVLIQNDLKKTKTNYLYCQIHWVRESLMTRNLPLTKKGLCNIRNQFQ